MKLLVNSKEPLASDGGGDGRFVVFPSLSKCYSSSCVCGMSKWHHKTG